MFMEHKFITTSDGFIRAIAICRQRLLDCNCEAVMGALIDRASKKNSSPESPVTSVSESHKKFTEISEMKLNNEFSDVAIETTNAIGGRKVAREQRNFFG